MELLWVTVGVCLCDCVCLSGAIKCLPVFLGFTHQFACFKFLHSFVQCIVVIQPVMGREVANVHAPFNGASHWCFLVPVHEFVAPEHDAASGHPVLHLPLPVTKFIFVSRDVAFWHDALDFLEVLFAKRYVLLNFV